MSQVNYAPTIPNAFPAASQMRAVAPDPFVRRLHALYPLEASVVSGLASLIETVRSVPSDKILLDEKQSPTDAMVLLNGLACHCRVLPNGRRQITGLILPGDFCDYSFLSSSPVRQSVYSLGPATVGRIDFASLSAFGDRYPGAVMAILRAASIEQACSRELSVSLGTRDAAQRLACFLCEIYIRMSEVGLVDHTGQFPLALTQADIGAALGLSAVHVNRTIQQLRRQGVISMSKSRVRIFSLADLAAIGSFDSHYLKSA